MRFPWSPRRNSAFVRNRPILRSAVMWRYDALFADREANEALYASVLADPPAPLSAEYLRDVFARRPDPSQSDASSEEVITHVFEHILGPKSWWGPIAETWRGPELFTAAYRDAIGRAQEAGNVPICTFHLQASSDGSLQLHVLETPATIVVLIATPPIPLSGEFDRKALKAREPRFGPTDEHMPEVSSYTIETLPMRG